MLTGTHPARFAHTGYSDPSARCTNPPGVHTGHPCHICNGTGWARPCLAWARPRAHLHRGLWALNPSGVRGSEHRFGYRANDAGYSTGTHEQPRGDEGVLKGYSRGTHRSRSARSSDGRCG